MSLICVVCRKVIVMSDNPDHYGVCAACPSNNLTKTATGENQSRLWKIKMAEKKQSTAVPITNGLFFPEDFRRLHRKHAIYIKQGVIIDLDKL
ncbi:MAG: hypothetical protein ABIG61_04250 [Planctomycetota bacterium]